MREDTKDLFRRFRNLNLLTLIGDLQMGRVAAKQWVVYLLGNCGYPLMCPIQHGLPTKIGLEGGLAQVRRHFGDAGDGFVNWWDGAPGWERQKLLPLLESIWAERLAQC